MDEAIRRANIMADHGADMIFYGHTIHTVEELKRIVMKQRFRLCIA